MDGGVWQKTMKGHVYTYMQGEEDYEKNTNLTSTYLIISECFNLYTVLWMSVSSSAFSPFLVIRPSIICRDQVARGHVCIKDLPRCGSIMFRRSVGGDGIILGFSSPNYGTPPCLDRWGQWKFLFGCWKSCEYEAEKENAGHFYTRVSVPQQTFLLLPRLYWARLPTLLVLYSRLDKCYLLSPLLSW